MVRIINRLALVGAIASLVVCAAFAQDEVEKYLDYKKVIEKTAGMVSDTHIKNLCGKHGLDILNVTWEDTGRFKNSSVGPNISDMTLQVQSMDPRDEKFRLYCMPVVRFPNFSDKTGDIPIEKFFLLVGNEKGQRLKKVNLKDFLADIRKHLHNPRSWKSDFKSLLAKRDTHVLASAQGCFLPVPKGGRAVFNPVLFNYQSYKKNPAVLTILATREGTSVTVIDNVRDGFQAGRTWGQRLFFNKNGNRAPLTAVRLSDYISKEEGKIGPGDGPSPIAKKHGGLSMVLLIQVPLKQNNPRPVPTPLQEGAAKGKDLQKAKPRESSDVEEAVIGHGRVEGPFTEIDNLEIQRDPKYPIRVTVQFYKATSNGTVTDKDIAAIKKQIGRVYSEADYVGSLVVEGNTDRPTEHDGPKVEQPEWWDDFWKNYKANTGQDPKESLDMLRKLYGPNWYPRNKFELYEVLGRINKQKEEQNKDK